MDTLIGDGATITAGQDVFLASRTHNHGEASATGTSIGIAGIGVIFAEAEVKGSTVTHDSTVPDDKSRGNFPEWIVITHLDELEQVQDDRPPRRFKTGREKVPPRGPKPMPGFLWKGQR